MAPLRNLGNVITIEGKSLSIIALATANIVIKGLGKIGITSRKVASIFDKGCFSNNHAAPMGAKGICVVVIHSILFRNHVSFEDTRFLIKFLKLILASSID